MKTFYIKKKNYETIRFDDEENVTIINLDDSMVTNLNRAGGNCWRLLDQKQDVDTLAMALLADQNSSERDSIDIDQLKRDIQDFLDQMVDCGLVDYA
ncbi:PqqD family protein [Sporolactobacillus spathodeae]|uniref:PqqD family protein n=1 Tax=Sporolactobacillus spathodeae TaxID=1465502 RepID=A0ABS2QCU5_9BACL|nr:PqqD family protein [Sporolactobacillus spathodeae]MBM7659135.1 hypothetical protein [Sporolactobacillus spathodeae]